VFDALSARIAESVGGEVGILSGSVCAATMLGVPDLALQTLIEFSDQVRRITRASNLSVFVDADHGYGNALNAMRTVEELEHAGLSGLAIEDVVLPARFGGPEAELISIEEMNGKLRAALATPPMKEKATHMLHRVAESSPCATHSFVFIQTQPVVATYPFSKIGIFEA
jgi:oxaloacetate decarboxylase